MAAILHTSAHVCNNLACLESGMLQEHGSTAKRPCSGPAPRPLEASKDSRLAAFSSLTGLPAQDLARNTGKQVR